MATCLRATHSELVLYSDVRSKVRLTTLPGRNVTRSRLPNRSTPQSSTKSRVESGPRSGTHSRVQLDRVFTIKAHERQTASADRESPRQHRPRGIAGDPVGPRMRARTGRHGWHWRRSRKRRPSRINVARSGNLPPEPTTLDRPDSTFAEVLQAMVSEDTGHFLSQSSRTAHKSSSFSVLATPQVRWNAHRCKSLRVAIAATEAAVLRWHTSMPSRRARTSIAPSTCPTRTAGCTSFAAVDRPQWGSPRGRKLGIVLLHLT